MLHVKTTTSGLFHQQFVLRRPDYSLSYRSVSPLGHNVLSVNAVTSVKAQLPGIV